MVRGVDTGQRRARLALRHGLAPPGHAHPAEVAESLVAVHATDPATVYLSIGARTGHRPEDIAGALHNGDLIRTTGMRRTVFVFPTALLQTVLDGVSRPLAVRDRATVLRYLEAELGWDSAALAEVEESVVRAVSARGEVGGAQLADDVPVLRTRIQPSGKGPTQAISMRILYNLAMTGRIARGRPAGGWTSSQYRWSAPGQLPDGDPAVARAALATRYLARYGPVTEADLKWWTGWTMGHTRTALTAIAAVPVTLDNSMTGYLLPDDLDPVPEQPPSVALLPALDSTVMGWRDRDWYLPPEQAPAHYDRTGNIGPTIWCDGRIVGVWAQHKDGRLVYRLLSDIGAVNTASVESDIDRLAGWLGGTKVSPRFHTPLEQELAQTR